MILIIKVIVIITIIILTTIIPKCRGRYRTPTTTNTELLVTLHNGRDIYVSEMTYLSLNVMNRSRPCRLNSLLGT